MPKHLLAGLALLSGTLAHAQTRPLQGFSETAARDQFALEERFDSYLHAADIDSMVRTMSARPHHVGSAGDQANTDYISAKFKSLGFNVQVETFYVLFPTPKERLLEMNGPTPYKALLAEPALKEDATSGQTAEQLPTYNCYSPDGDVTAELVFVNYGIPEDYDRLERLGISVKGKIVLAKYGHSWRGIKPKVAQEHGAVGCIIYSDPRDDGYFQGDDYPKGAFKNEYGVQRGSVMDIPIYPGDPLTPGIGATKDAKRLGRKDVVNLLKIPVLPISYHDAEPLLRSLEGPVAPEDWRGALPFTYHVGPGTAKVHLRLAFNWDIKPIHDIIARIPGSQWPDQWVIRGNHYDAWVNGAADPISGQAAMLEEAGAVSQLLATGWKPKRTLVYCAWDAEEPGLLGSTEWVETHADELRQKAVVYVNSDVNGRGFLAAEGSHALEPFFNEVARDVTDPEMQISIGARKKARELVEANAGNKLSKELLAKKTFAIGGLGSGSDYSPFIQHIAVPSLDLSFGGEDEGGDYHSIYDSYDDYRRFKDPGFQYGIALAKTAGRVMLRMADVNLLPFDFRAFSRTVGEYATDLITIMDQSRAQYALQRQLLADKDYTYAGDPTMALLPPVDNGEPPFLNFSSLQNALSRLERSATRLSDMLTGSPLSAAASVQTKVQTNFPAQTGPSLPAASSFSAGKLDQINHELFTAEQELLFTGGLPRRPWYRHMIYAPGFYTGYGVKTLPGIREAIEQRNWKEAQEQIALASDALNRLSDHLDSIRP